MKTINIVALAALVIISCIAQSGKPLKTVSKVPVKTTNARSKTPSAQKPKTGTVAKVNPNERYFTLYANGRCTIKNGYGKVIIESTEDEIGEGGGLTKETEGYPTAIWIHGDNNDGTSIGWGFMDQKNKIIIPMIYNEPQGFSEGLAAVSLKSSGIYGFIDKTGKTIIPFQYDIADNFSEGMAQVRKKQDQQTKYKSGFIDKTGAEVIPAIYDVASKFKEGMAAVQLNGKCGYIDKTGKVVIPLEFDGANDFENGFAVVNKGGKTLFTMYAWDGKVALIDRNGKLLTDFKYDYIKPFEGNFAHVTIKQSDILSKNGYVNKEGKEVIPVNYDFISPLSSSYFAVILNKKQGVIDSVGNIVLPIIYDKIDPSYSEPEWLIKLADKFGFINGKGQIIIQPIYEDAATFSKGLASVKQNGKWGYIDVSGTVIIPFKYDEARYFDPYAEGKDIAEVVLNGETFNINKKGERVK